MAEQIIVQNLSWIIGGGLMLGFMAIADDTHRIAQEIESQRAPRN